MVGIGFLCLVVATIGLVEGSVWLVSAERLAQRKVEEVMETRGIVTLAVEREVQAGHVDVTVQRRILGLVPFSTKRFADVVRAEASGGTNYVARSPGGKGGSSYSTSWLKLTLRDGTDWRTPEASYLIGSSPGSVAEQLEDFIDHSTQTRYRGWWASWFSNFIGIPFALLILLPLLSLLRSTLVAIATKLGLRRPPAENVS